MLRLLLICLALVATPIANACLCDYLPLETYIKRFPFIAHVRVLEKIGKNDTVYYKESNYTRVRYKEAPKLVLQILELFKGDSVKSIFEFGVNSSCEIGVEAGEEWIIFGEYYEEAKEYAISACNPSSTYRHRDGQRRWDEWGEVRLNALRKHFNHPPPESLYTDGQHRQLYPNGKTEWTACYNDGVLDGNRKIYYPNGRLYYDEQFVNGTADGQHKRYYSDGGLYKESLYKNGKCIYYKEWGHPDYGQVYRIHKEYHYRDSTYSILKEYDDKGKLTEELEENESADTYERRSYYPNGKLQVKTTVWRRADKAVYLYYKEDGTFERKRTETGAKGKIIED